MRGSKSNARTVGQPQPRALGLRLWNLQPFFLPYAMNAVASNLKALKLKHRRDRFVSVAAVLFYEFQYAIADTFTLGVGDLFIALSCAQLTDNPTRFTLGNLKAIPQVKNRFALTCRA